MTARADAAASAAARTPLSGRGTVEPSRIAPGDRRAIGAVNWLIARAIGRAAGTREPPHLFTTLARHRRLFRRWLWFAGALMPRGSLERVDTELVILRVAHNCDCEYEWRHHQRLARRARLTAASVERVREGPQAQGWSGRESLLLRFADALHEHQNVPDELWSALSGELSQVELIELVILIGHYEMLAATIKTLRIAPDELARPG